LLDVRVSSDIDSNLSVDFAAHLSPCGRAALSAVQFAVVGRASFGEHVNEIFDASRRATGDA
jgi:hypothetical protein